MTPSMREMVATRRLKLGTFVVEFDTPGMGQIIKAAGGDFVIVDMEHSGFNYAGLKRMLRYYQSADVRVIVSTAVGDYNVIRFRLSTAAAPQGSVSVQRLHARWRPPLR